MRKKILLISFLLSLPFWWGINTLAKNLEDFLFLQEIANNSKRLTSNINQNFLQGEKKRLEKERMQIEYLKDLEIEAKSAISIEIDRNGRERILFEKNSEDSLPIASLTKLMTALIVFDLNETSIPQLITITQEAVSQEGSSKYGDLKIGEKLSIESLLHIMLIESSNDAAFALSQSIGQEGFVDLMNFYANDLEMKDTHFVNPTGLEPEGYQELTNLSTARDLVKLANFIIINYPQIFEITDKSSYEVLNPDGSIHHFIPENTNELLKESDGWQSRIIGGKTGWSPGAGGCLLLVLEGSKKDGYFINIILGSNDRFGEMKKIIEAIEQAQNF